MRYVVILPAYDEERLIGQAIACLISQSLRPTKLIVVDDGSSDSTYNIVANYVSKYPWIKLIRNPNRSTRSVGAKVIEAFNLGYQSIKEEFAFIVKMDADLLLPENYFESIANHFMQNPKLGIIGGKVMINKNDVWVEEDTADADHVKGACKSYRADCFKDIGGILTSIGWDTADELLARYHGWHILVDSKLEIRHYRKMGTHTHLFKLQRLVGQGMYRLRYGFPITVTSAVKAGLLNRPFVLTGLMVLIGWFQSWLNRESFIVTKDEGRFIRMYRLQRMMDKIRSFMRLKN